MAGTAVRGRLTWQTATVGSVVDETPRARTLTLEVPGWPGSLAGQHVDVRLTADDGYQAERAYSIASAPGEPLAITVERLDDGEVSPYLTSEARPGDLLEVRGPVGGYFVWEPRFGGPLLLVAGGSGIVPLRAMLRHRFFSGSSVPVRLLYSSRSLADVIYRAELDALPDVAVFHALTRTAPPGWTGYARRVDAAMLAEVAWPAALPSSGRPLAYVCGPTPFVESVAAGLVGLGYPAVRVRTERFGATGAGGLAMDALDGNAIGGMLIEVFGREMTTATATCGSCGSVSVVAGLAVYLSGPGTVVRCRACGAVLMTFVRIRDVTCVDLLGLASLG